MEIRQIVNTVFRSCSYVIAHDGGSWLVDCGDVDRILPMLDGTLRGVLLTHGHFDHIYGLNVLTSFFPSLPILTNQAGMKELLNDRLNFSRYYGDPFVLDVPDNVRILEDRDSVDLFAGISAKALFTPGHSPSCITWLIGDSLFTGDSFIPGVKTVTNVPHADKALAVESERIIHQLADHRIVYAGHATEYEL